MSNVNVRSDESRPCSEVLAEVITACEALLSNKVVPVATTFRASFARTHWEYEKLEGLNAGLKEEAAIRLANGKVQAKLEEDFRLCNAELSLGLTRQLARILVVDSQKHSNGASGNTAKEAKIKQMLADFRTWWNQQISWEAKFNESIDIGGAVSPTMKTVENILQSFFNELLAPTVEKMPEAVIPEAFAGTKKRQPCQDKSSYELFEHYARWAETAAAQLRGSGKSNPE